jgi:hypothetical protein
VLVVEDGLQKVDRNGCHHGLGLNNGKVIEIDVEQ